ncbi:MAG: hypothetical protein EXR79_15535 [Myxococcales bacterium]|nr:hypothetical protein [Myxococcales bacterium]
MPPTDIDLRREFETEGWVVLRGHYVAAVLPPWRAACNRLLAEASALHGGGRTGMVMHRGSQFVLGDAPAPPDGSPPAVRIDRIVWAGAAEPVLLEPASDPLLLQRVGAVLGVDRVQQLINQVHFKLPGDGVEFPWHQDSAHRRYGTSEWTDVTGRGSYVQVVTLLDDCDLANGPLLFVRGSCRHGHVEPDADGELPAWLRQPEDVVAVTGKAGDVVLFGPYTVHGSSRNTSQRPRRLLIHGYAAAGANTRVYPGEGAGRWLEIPPARPSVQEPR